MGGYFSKKEDKTGGGGNSHEATDSSSEDAKKSRYKVVYLNRDVKLSELPPDLSSLFVLRRTG